MIGMSREAQVHHRKPRDVASELWLEPQNLNRCVAVAIVVHTIAVKN